MKTIFFVEHKQDAKTQYKTMSIVRWCLSFLKQKQCDYVYVEFENKI